MSFLFAGNIDLSEERFNRERCRGDLFIQYGRGFRYYRMKDTSVVQELIDRFKPTSMFWVEKNADISLPAHTDRGTLTALNLYVAPHGSTTSFWNPKPGEEPHAWPQEKDPKIKNMWLPEQLDLSGSFVAKPGDVYWLDVSKIHTVHGTVGAAPRTFVQLCWSNTTFKELACSL